MVDDFKKNKEGIEESLSFFDKKFRRYYKEGHLILACHAAFPVSVSVDLLYQLWANFKSYQSRNGSNEVIPLLAVSDLLLSSFFRQTSKDVYEMQQHARTYLLDKLTADPRFGELRIKELASFLFQYIKNQPDRPETRNFREAQKWAAILAVDPAAATQEILLSLKKKIENSQVNSSIGIVNMIEDLVEGNPLFAEKMASHLQAQEIDPPKPVASAEIQGEQKSIILSDKAWPGAIQLKINLPAHISNRLKIIKTEQELKKAMIEPVVERIFAPMVGISEYQSQSMRLTGPVNDVKKLSHAI
ncbi:MAG: hypothetical protein ABIQ56_05445, partial [Chitinophagaceae bacterium]